MENIENEVDDDWGYEEESINGKLISAEELIKKLEELAGKIKNPDTRNGLCAAVNLIYELPDAREDI